MIYDKDALIALRERVREAGGADGSLDRDIRDAIDRDGGMSLAPAYTASIDAGLALVERELPGWQHVTWGGVWPYGGIVELRSGAPECFVSSGEANSLPLAILDALLTALIERKA